MKTANEFDEAAKIPALDYAAAAHVPTPGVPATSSSVPPTGTDQFDQAALIPAPPKTAPKPVRLGLPRKHHKFILTGLVLTAVVLLYAVSAVALILHQIDVATFKELILGFGGLLGLAGVAFANLFRS